MSFFLLTAFIVPAGCSSFHKKDNKRHYAIKRGETFQVMLDNNPSTGSYICLLNQQAIKVATLEKSEWIRNGAEDCDGCGGTEVYTFRGIAVGTDSIKMKTMYAQNGQPGCPQNPAEQADPGKLFIVTVE